MLVGQESPVTNISCLTDYTTRGCVYVTSRTCFITLTTPSRQDTTSRIVIDSP
ncbi:hypothetical protein Hanom_Chr12g01073701 [Helianthus anomalus]